MALEGVRSALRVRASPVAMDSKATAASPLGLLVGCAPAAPRGWHFEEELSKPSAPLRREISAMWVGEAVSGDPFPEHASSEHHLRRYRKCSARTAQRRRQDQHKADPSCGNSSCFRSAIPATSGRLRSEVLQDEALRDSLNYLRCVGLAGSSRCCECPKPSCAAYEPSADRATDSTSFQLR